MKKIIEDFIPQGGKHCITNALKQVFTYHNHPVSEEMLFGLASGLTFVYINLSHSPMISGRSKVFEFEEILANRLNITIRCRSGKNQERILEATKAMIDTNQPILIYVDMAYLSYLHMDQNAHFGGHAVVLFGYDDTTKKFYISDRDNRDFAIRTPNGNIQKDYHLVSYEELEKARSSSFRPFPANNKYLTFDFENYQEISSTMILEAIAQTCQQMLNPPANLLGINGIMKFSKEIGKWKKFTPQKIKTAGITNYFQINKDGGTGGGLFRKMYGEFLIEAASIVKNQEFITLGNRFIEVSDLWEEVASYMWKLAISADIEVLEIMQKLIVNIYDCEKELYLDLQKVVQSNQCNS